MKKKNVHRGLVQLYPAGRLNWELIINTVRLMVGIYALLYIIIIYM